MSDEIKIDGSFNIPIQNVGAGATVEVTQILAKSYEYNDLLDKIKTKQELFELVPEENIDRRLQLSAEINQIKETFEQFKRDVLALAETFNKIEINTDRLRRAKEFFDKGEIGEARAVLETELEQMQNEQTHLLREKEHFEKNVLPNLINNSEEFYLLAMATQADYTNPNRFEDTCKYFERSIESHVNKDNVFNYAKFLQIHTSYDKAQQYYEIYLKNFTKDLSLVELAIAHNNIGINYKNKKDLKYAIRNYENSLRLFRQLANLDQPVYLPYVAILLRNLAIFHRDLNKNVIAASQFKEAISIFETLSEESPSMFLPYLAATLNSVAKMHKNKNEYEIGLKKCEESLRIRNEIARYNPKEYLKDVASSLNRLADFHSAKEEYHHLAIQEYEKALIIRQELAIENPQAFSHHLASTLLGLAKLFESQNLIERASAEYEKVLAIYFAKSRESTNEFLPIMAKILMNLSVLYRKQKKYKKARDKASASIKIIYDLNRNDFLYIKHKLYTESGNECSEAIL